MSAETTMRSSGERQIRRWLSINHKFVSVLVSGVSVGHRGQSVDHVAALQRISVKIDIRYNLSPITVDNAVEAQDFLNCSGNQFRLGQDSVPVVVCQSKVVQHPTNLGPRRIESSH